MKMKIWRRRCLCRQIKDPESRISTQTRMAIRNRRITANQSFRKMTDNIVKINTKTNNKMTGEIRNSKSSSLIKIRHKITKLRTSAQKENIMIVGTLTRLTSGQLASPPKNIKRSPKVSTTHHKTTNRLSSRLTSSTIIQTQTHSFRNSSSSRASNISPSLPSTTKTIIMVTKTRSRTHTTLQTISSKTSHLIHSAKVYHRISMRLFHKILKSHFS